MKPMTAEKKGKREKETVKPVKGKKDELSDKDLEKASGGLFKIEF